MKLNVFGFAISSSRECRDKSARLRSTLVMSTDHVIEVRRLNSRHVGLLSKNGLPVVHDDRGAVSLHGDGAAMAFAQIELLEVPVGRHEIRKRTKSHQPTGLQVETERIQRKRQTAADALDKRFLQRPDREERVRQVLSGNARRCRASGCCEESLAASARYSAGRRAFFDVDADLALSAHRQGDGTAAMRQIESQRRTWPVRIGLPKSFAAN